MRTLIIFFGIFAFIGTGALVFSLIFGYQSLEKINTWEEAPATLTGFDWGDSPIIEFQYHGQKKRFNSSFTSSDMVVGQSLQIHYPPGNPGEAEIKNFFNLWFLPLFFSVFTLS